MKVSDTRERSIGRKVLAALAAVGESDVRAGTAGARGKTVAPLGLTFKPDTDDMRDAPSLAIAQSPAMPTAWYARTIRRAWTRHAR